MAFQQSNNIKVVHCVESWLPQTATWLYNQIRFLPEGVENFVVCQGTQNLDQFQIPNISSLEDMPKWQKYFQKLYCKFRPNRRLGNHLSLLETIIQTRKPDILHSHFGHLGWVNSNIAKTYNLKHIVSFYGADVNYIPKKDYRWLNRYKQMSSTVSQILCEGPHMAHSIEKLGFPSKKINIHRLGIDLEKIRFEPRRFFKGETLRFLIVGSFREKKGIPYALEALGQFSKMNDNIEITVIGGAGNSQREAIEEQKIIDQIKYWNLESKVRLLGFQPHNILLKEAYKHHIFISPSVTSEDGDTEGGAPVSIIEMAASGMPIVTTNHCDIPYVLSEKNKAYLSSERDSRALCNTIESLIESNWNNLLLSNRQLIEQEMDVKKQSKRLHDIYRNSLS